MRRRKYDYSNIFQENIFPQLVYITRQDFSVENQDRPLHTHDFLCELNIIYKGSGTYNVDSDSYPLRAGDLIFHNCDEAHELLSSKDDPAGAYCLGYTNVMFQNHLENHMTRADEPRVCSAGKQFPLIRELAEKLLDLDLNQPNDQTLANILATSLLLVARSVPQDHREDVLSHASNELTRQVKDYISEHFREDIKLDEIARELNFSTTYISHTFKKATGHSPIEYVIRRRIGYAQTLLISSDLSVTHIATLSGYDNPNHFQTIFKKTTGITPLQYRKRYLKNLKGTRDQR